MGAAQVKLGDFVAVLADEMGPDGDQHRYIMQIKEIWQDHAVGFPINSADT
jgi:hypothetical protein